MPQGEITGPGQTDRSIVDKLWSKRAELLWGLVVVIMLLTFVKPVVLIGACVGARDDRRGLGGIPRAHGPCQTG